MLHSVLLPWIFLANANGVYGLYLIVFKQGDPATYGTYRSSPVNVIDAWQLDGTSNDMTRREENVIERPAQPTEQALKQAFVKIKVVFHKECLSKYDGVRLKTLQVDLTEEVGLVFIPNINVRLLTTLSFRTSAVF